MTLRCRLSVSDRCRNAVSVVCKQAPTRLTRVMPTLNWNVMRPVDRTGSTYTWLWSPTTNLTDHNTGTPTFAVPDDVDQDTTYTYKATVSDSQYKQCVDDGTAEVMVTVRDTDSTDPSLTCTDSEVYEGAADSYAGLFGDDRSDGATSGTLCTFGWLTTRGTKPSRYSPI